MRSAFGWVWALALFGCAEGPGIASLDDLSIGMPGAGMAGVPADGPATGAPGAGAGFEATVMPLINEACNCHQSEPILMAPFSLKVGEAYQNLVNKPSAQQPAMMLVSPGSLNDSYLWHKLNNTQLEVMGMGVQMPSTIPLDATQLGVIATWITQGAQP